MIVPRSLLDTDGPQPDIAAAINKTSNITSDRCIDELSGSKICYNYFIGFRGSNITSPLPLGKAPRGYPRVRALINGYKFLLELFIHLL